MRTHHVEDHLTLGSMPVDGLNVDSDGGWRVDIEDIE